MKTMLFPCAALALGALSACGNRGDVTLYVALDEEHSRSLIEAFTEETGIEVNARYDTEASKTVGLVSAIIEESSRPRCDVFWNNEIAHTVRLAQKGLLQPYDSPAAAGIPEQWRDTDRKWTGFAARARIIIVNTERLPNREDWPTSIWDLLDPKWKGDCAIAKPLTGTTLTHFVALRGVLGEAEFQRFYEGLFGNEVKLLQSNGATMRETQAGKVAWAFTDTDDFHVSLQKGNPVACVFPDQGEGQIGTMLIPNSAAMIAGAPHPDPARKLLDYILSASMEAKLAAARSAQIPLRPGVKGPEEPTILGIGEFREMEWDLEWTAENLNPMSEKFAERMGL